MQYKTLNEQIAHKINRREILYGIVSGMVLIPPFVLVTHMIITKSGKFREFDTVLRWTVIISDTILLITMILIFIYVMKLYLHRGDIALFAKINDDKISLTMLNGKEKVYLFSQLLSDITVYVNFYFSFFKSPKGFRYNSISKFLNEGGPKILDTLKSSRYIISDETLFNIVINKQRKGVGWFFLIISPSVIGGVERVENMLNEWKEKYENYLRKTGKYNEILEKERYTEEEDRKKAVRHLLYLIGLIAFGVVSLIYLSLIPYVNTPKSSPDYDIVVTLLALDLSVTLTLVLLGIMIILSLWRKHIKRSDGK
ncbi:MAG: hypothetical protein J7K08_02230 [Thermoplasmata archaeon]|nr:hypothetical protein [Thermoplasmata archaeon]